MIFFIPENRLDMFSFSIDGDHQHHQVCQRLVTDVELVQPFIFSKNDHAATTINVAFPLKIFLNSLKNQGLLLPSTLADLVRSFILNVVIPCEFPTKFNQDSPMIHFDRQKILIVFRSYYRRVLRKWNDSHILVTRQRPLISNAITYIRRSSVFLLSFYLSFLITGTAINILRKVSLHYYLPIFIFCYISVVNKKKSKSQDAIHRQHPPSRNETQSS